MSDPTESIRRQQVAEINAEPGSREYLEAKHGGEVWDTTQLQQRFTVLGFLSPYCVVMDRESGKKGSVMFQASPRYYFGFQPE